MNNKHISNRSQSTKVRVSVISSLLLFAGLLSGCGPGPGAPLVRTSISDGEGPLVPGCQNVSSLDTSLKFNPDSYLTTWGSAWRSGAAAGLHDGLQQGLRDVGTDIPDNELRSFAYGTLPDSEVFCRIYNAKPRKIYKLVVNMIPKFGYRWKYRSRKHWLLATNYVERTHKRDRLSLLSTCKNCEKLIFKSKWKDRFFIHIESFNSVKSIVRIRRDIFISRRTKNEWSDYIKETSVGYNEAVILNRIAQKL